LRSGLPKLAGYLAQDAFETTCHVTAIAKANPECNLRNIQTAVLQQILRPIDPTLQNVSVWCNTQAFLKQP